ncbi:hypothetical protein PCI56_00325 [Plesiomonas shigelloides subsp. oncorhynchi]|nr:hypothetical protein [Plesiomonas shigelloides]
MAKAYHFGCWAKSAGNAELVMSMYNALIGHVGIRCLSTISRDRAAQRDRVATRLSRAL